MLPKILEILITLQYLLLLQQTSLSSSARVTSRYILTWTSIMCTHNANYIRSLNCSIHQPDLQHMEITVMFARNIVAGCFGHLKMDVPRPGGNNMRVMDFDMGVCEFLRGKHINNFVAVLRHGFLNHGNFTNCPLQKDITYGLFNFTLDINKMPYAPETNLTMNIIFRVPPDIEIARLDISANLDQRRKRKIAAN